MGTAAGGREGGGRGGRPRRAVSPEGEWPACLGEGSRVCGLLLLAPVFTRLSDNCTNVELGTV